MTDVTTPFEMTASADAFVPPPPISVTVGRVTYPEPPSVIRILATPPFVSVGTAVAPLPASIEISIVGAT